MLLTRCLTSFHICHGGFPGTRGTSQHKLHMSMCFIGLHQSRIDKELKKTPQNGFTKPDQIINRLEWCGGQVSAGIHENRGVLALLEGDSLHWNISGEENRTGVVNTLLQREGLLVCQVSASKFAVTDLY